MTKTLTFKVVDTKKPILYGIKSKSNIAAGTTLNVLSGVTAKMVSGKNITSKIKVYVTYGGQKVSVSSGRVTFSKAGTYTIKYSVTTSSKKTKTKTVKYTVAIDKSLVNLTLVIVTYFNLSSVLCTSKTYNPSDLTRNMYFSIS